MTSSRSYAEFFLPEDEPAIAARGRAGDLGCVPIGTGGGAALKFLAAAVNARAVVEIGTGAGVSGLHLLAGMAPDGILTSIDAESVHLRAAKTAFTEAGIAPGRTRLINGRALEVLPRLTDGAYDLVFIDADKPSFPEYVQQAIRLLKTGGLLIINDALDKDRVSDPAIRETSTVVLRQVGKLIREHDSLISAMLPTGDGLLLAVKR